MVRQFKGQGHHGKGGVRITGGGDYRCSSDKQIANVVDLAIAVYDALGWLGSHSGGPQMVVSAADLLWHV